MVKRKIRPDDLALTAEECLDMWHEAYVQGMHDIVEDLWSYGLFDKGGVQSPAPPWLSKAEAEALKEVARKEGKIR
jgi:hypothetical protein